MIDNYTLIVPGGVPASTPHQDGQQFTSVSQFNSIYLPAVGRYRPMPVKDASSYGYPWQHNPMLHKVTSEPSMCSRRNVFRIYLDNRVFYTRTNKQVADGFHSYYLYDEQGRITETGEVRLPIHFTDDNWYQYPYKDCHQQAAFIRSLGCRTNVMVATYNDTQTTSGGEQLYFYPVKTIRCHALIEADTPMDAEGHYITLNNSTHYHLVFNSKEDVQVSITVHDPAVARASAILQTQVAPHSSAIHYHVVRKQKPIPPATYCRMVTQPEKRNRLEINQPRQYYLGTPAFAADRVPKASIFSEYDQTGASPIPVNNILNGIHAECSNAQPTCTLYNARCLLPYSSAFATPINQTDVCGAINISTHNTSLMANTSIMLRPPTYMPSAHPP